MRGGNPDWFDTWSEAVGLPVQKFKDRESLDAGNWRMREKPGLLILGTKGGRPRSGRCCRLAAEHKINVLVLEADWFAANETARREMVLSPKQMAGALADLQTQQWPLPPAFRPTRRSGDLEPADVDRRPGVSAGRRNPQPAKRSRVLADRVQLSAVAAAAWTHAKWPTNCSFDC